MCKVSVCDALDKANVQLEEILKASGINPEGLYVGTDFIVGDLENRSPVAKEPRLEEVLKAIADSGIPCRGLIRGGLLTGILLKFKA